MDALSEVLRLARFAADVTLDATAGAPWCVSVPASSTLARGYLVLEGECRLRLPEGQELRLGTGSLAFLPTTPVHLIGSDFDAQAVPIASLQRAPLAGEFVPVRLGGHGPATRWLAIAATFERHLADPLLASLPPVIAVDVASATPVAALTAAVGLNLTASDAPAAGAAARRERLAELVIIEALRRHIQSMPAGGKGWLAGLNDRYVGRALALVHGRPGEPWTVEKLGRQVGLSRSALAERFGLAMGEPIIAFLTRWRLQLAAETLLTTSRPVAAIAREAGYESASAFAHAFRRAFRKSPSAWRKRARRRTA